MKILIAPYILFVDIGNFIWYNKIKKVVQRIGVWILRYLLERKPPSMPMPFFLLIIRREFGLEKYIILEGNVTTNTLYTSVLHSLRDYYRCEKEVAPVLDLTKVTFIEPEAIPLLISFGDYFSRLYHSEIEIDMEERGPLQNFLINIGFLRYTKDEKIYYFANDYMKNWLYANRDIHKIIWMKRAEEYSDVASIADLEVRRTYLSDNIQKNIEEQCTRILSDTHKLPENLIKYTIEGLAEIITNASIYSENQSYAYLASDKFGTKGSVCDCGVGLEYSYEKQGKKCEWIYNNDDIMKNPELKNFYLIMEIMNYSYCKHRKGERCNLWTVQNDFTTYGGSFKIHYGNIQVIFSSKRCRGCRKVSYFNEEGNRIFVADDLQPCLVCLREGYFSNQNLAITNYDVAFRGVHIEFEIPRR
ncbi:MAG: hypothetical protein J1F42_10955 [Lachnospiraceae bacterium]|nr:hypothetical protein [Lachnospiraceae bacterium]